MRYAGILVIAFLAAAGRLSAQDLVSTGKYLYTKPDRSAGGGIKGLVVKPRKPLADVFALPPGEPRHVYKGIIVGEDRNQFEFKGLPTDRYDLFLLYDQACYEGLTLTRRRNTLTSEDERSVRRIITKSEPFFNKKNIYRMAGITGDGESARCICVYERTRKSTDYGDGVYLDHRRSFKLVVLKDVGPAWQIVRSREIDVRFFEPGRGVKHYYREKLGRIRVIDEIKDLGELDLTRNYLTERKQ